MPASGRGRLPERPRRGFVLAAMHSPFTWPLLAGSLVASVAFGIHLGESSVGLINPIYFQAPPLHPRERGAAIDESTLGRTPDAYAGLYGWEQGQAALAADCGDCAVRDHDSSGYSARVPYFGSGGELHRAVSHAREELGEDFAEPPADLSQRERNIERYAYYPSFADPAKSQVEAASDTNAEPSELAFAKDDQE